MQPHINRRGALRLGLFGMAAGGVASTLGPQAFGAPRLTGMGSQAGVNKVLLVFLRGGNDALNTVIPDGDRAYAKLRGANSSVPANEAVQIASNDSLSLNGFARLHPALTDIHPLYSSGELALMHRIGHAFPNFSHFTAQQYWETGYPGSLVPLLPGNPILLENGFVTGAFKAASLSGLNLPGASVSKDLQRLFATNIQGNVLAHIPEVEGFLLDDGGLAAGPLGKLRDALKGSNGAFSTPQGGNNKALLGTTGQLSFEAAEEVIAAQGYVPDPGVVYPVAQGSSASGIPLANSSSITGFGNQLKGAMALLKNTDCRIVGVELGGFDTHSKQGGITGQHADQLRALSVGMRAIFDDTRDTGTAPNLVTITMSEFGRESAMNGSAGTDHGTSGVMLAMGDDLNGGVYNCNPADGTWAPDPTGPAAPPAGDMVAQFGKHVPYLTDYRAVLAEVLDKHLGVSRTGFTPEMNDVFLAYNTLVSLTAGTEMDDLGIL